MNRTKIELFFSPLSWTILKQTQREKGRVITTSNQEERTSSQPQTPIPGQPCSDSIGWFVYHASPDDDLVGDEPRKDTFNN